MLKHMSIYYLAGILLAAVSVTSFASETKNRSKILFVYLQYDKGKLTLVKTKLATGTLKRKRNNAITDGALYCEITGKRGDSLSSQIVQSPQQVHYDYIDQNGKLRGGILESPSEMFFVRVPYDSAMKSVSLYSINKSCKSRLEKSGTVKLKDSLIATFPLNVEEKR